MQLVSLNTNKRLRTPEVQRRLPDWLMARSCDVLASQEAWPERAAPVSSLGAYLSAGGNHYVHNWISSTISMPSVIPHDERWQHMVLGFIQLHNVYLSAHSVEQRLALLYELTEYAKKTHAPIVITGDFNFAPHPEDGLVDGRVSSWTSAEERDSLGRLLSEGRLVDLTLPDAPGAQVFTIERTIGSRRTQFRCDLALASDYLVPDLCARYDHSVRCGGRRLTDHSAIIVEIPMDVPKPSLFSTSECACSAGEYSPHKTAMARNDASAIARSLFERGFINRWGVRSILDYGCGRGQDVSYYESLGIDAQGYDPWPAYGRTRLPERRFDLVTMVFVLNVLSDPLERINALLSAANLVNENGHLVVAVRSHRAIEREARLKGWPRHNDGFWSSLDRGTFQKGLLRSQLEKMICRTGLLIESTDLPASGDVTLVMAVRNTP